MEQIADVDNEIGLDGEEENGVGAADGAFPSLRRLCLRDLRSLRVFGVSFPFIGSDVCYGLPEMKALPFEKGMTVKKLKRFGVTDSAGRSWTWKTKIGRHFYHI
ncbi:hypothetical protein MA16_Dca027586 [Dendrobium catenatum]|uniref:Uncharacterized protein n=1 Tax=Dendrobium catenatum TaxID=906689 RepID=A0A2I0VBJ4_9ASPA|nr:hypothetical protein MA16_Dca027586 [Dendrobium catenatum]